jgi:hypothetical protein
VSAWLAVIVAVLKAVTSLSAYLGDRKLIEAGKAEALQIGLALTLESVEKSNVAVHAVSNPHSDYAQRVRAEYERPDE